MRRFALLAGGLAVLAGCAGGGGGGPAPLPQAAPDVLAARLPETVGGFERRATLPLQAPLRGQEVAYATRGRFTAAGLVQLVAPEGGPPPDGPDSPAVTAALEDLLEEVVRRAPSVQRMREGERFTVAASGVPALRCVALEGTAGRNPVEGITCAGAAAGAVVRLRAQMQRRPVPVADLRGFAEGIATAVRGR